MEKKNVVFLTVLAVATLLTAVVGTTFAYFTATVTGNDTATETRITTATLGVTYSDGSQVTGTNIIPGWSQAKTIKVKNTSNVDLTYAIMWTNITNSFVEDTKVAAHCSDASITDQASCVSPATWTPAVKENNFYYNVVASTENTTTPSAVSTLNTFNSNIAMPAQGNDVAFTSGQVIKPGEEHTYVVTMAFNNADYPQDDNQGQTFKSTFQVVTTTVQSGN